MTSEQSTDNWWSEFEPRGSGPILFVTSVGATLRLFVSPLAEHLHRLGIQTVGVSGALGEANGFDRLHPLPAFRRTGPLAMARAALRLRDIVRREKPSLLHLHTPPALVIGRLVSRSLGVPSIGVVHGTFLEPLTYRSFAFAAVEAVLAPLSKRTVVVNDDDGRFYRRLTRAGSVLVAPVGGMGIDVTRLRAALARPVLSDSAPSVVTVGRLTPEKNLDLIVKAFRDLRRRHPSAALTFIGSSESGDRSWKVPVGHGIRHIEWLEDPYPVIAGADLLIAGSRREGFPMVVAEALLLGLPVVAVSNRGVRQIRQTERYRLAVVKDDAKMLAEAIITSLSLGKRGYIDESLAARWSVASAVQFHSDVIRSVIAESKNAKSTG